MTGSERGRHRTVPSQVALLVSSKAGPAVGLYSQYLKEELQSLFPSEVYVDSTPSRSPLLHVQQDMGTRSFRPRLACPRDVYRVATVHELPENDGQRYHELNDFDAVVVHTPRARELLAARTSARVVTIPYGSYDFAPLPRDEARTALALPLDKKIVLSFNLFATPGFEADALGAARLMGDVLFAVTSEEKHRPLFSFGVHSARLPDNVLRLGRLDEERTNLYASAADVLLLPSNRGGGVVSVSASLHRLLAAGKPIVGPEDDPSLSETEGWGGPSRYKRADLGDLQRVLASLLADRDAAAALGEKAKSLAVETSWERVAKSHLQLYGDLIGDFFGVDWYDEEYYAGPNGGKEFFSGSRVEHWSYFNPAGEWTGAKTVMQAIKSVLDPREMLSVGEGRGTFLAYGADVGISVRGIDFSKWAVEHPYSRAKGMIEWGDARDLSRFADNSFDLVFASDLMEHIYLDDLQTVIGEIQRVSRRWAFYNNGGTELGNLPPMFMKKNELPPKALQGTAIAGHVVLQPCGWWETRLSGGQWQLRPDLVGAFRSFVDAVDPRILGNWKCVIIAEKLQR